MSIEVPTASLDLGKNNSRASDAPENGRYDCREVYGNFRYENPEGETAPYRCNSWDCYCCGYRMRMNLVEEISRVVEERPQLSRLLTLTLDPAKAPESQEERHRYVTERWNAMRTAINDEYGGLSYIWVREEQENGLPHLHILVSRFLPQAWVSEKWAELGGGEIVDIRQIERVEKAAHYVGKYLTKDALSGLPDGTRRYGSSADIELAVRGSGGSDGPSEWGLVMDDYRITREGEPLTRGVVPADYVEQRENGGPVGKGPPPDPPPDSGV